jgi:hypothetical protein
MAANKPAKELPLAAGYPDAKTYVFNNSNADDIVEKLLAGDKLYLDPLIWNLRPASFEAAWDSSDNSIHLYDGRLYLPDSHHRQQAILKAVRLWRECKTEYPRFSDERQFTVQLYFLNREDEGNYFFDKNQRPRPTAQSKAFDLTTTDDLSLLAKKVIEKSKGLRDNVNRVTDRLAANNPQVVTLSTLREMMKGFADSDVVGSAELEGMAQVAAQFYDMLVSVRPELGSQPLNERKRIREKLVVDSAVMMHGYVNLLRSYNVDLTGMGTVRAEKHWREHLGRLSSSIVYSLNQWSGDLFDKRNPLWQRAGVTKPGKQSGKLTVINTGGARSECGRILYQLVSLQHSVVKLSFLLSSK